jgi:bifunctional enzyme Fae/Hps
MILNRKWKYLQIALNSDLTDAYEIIKNIPKNNRILLEAGTPLLKRYGVNAIKQIIQYWNWKNDLTLPYVVADLKTMDRAQTEVAMVKNAGASAAICLGLAPIETVNNFIESCQKYRIDSMLDMMNVEYPIKILRLLKKMPDIVLLHRGVDEEFFNKNKPIPFIQINKILSSYNVMISIAGGDTIREVQRAVFNGANIVVVWKEFYQVNENTGSLATEFLKIIK